MNSATWCAPAALSFDRKWPNSSIKSIKRVQPVDQETVQIRGADLLFYVRVGRGSAGLRVSSD